jgi:hypothetical protein
MSEIESIFKITINNKHITIYKLNDDEYEISLLHQYFKYIGILPLKKIKINNIKEYLDYCNNNNSIILEEICDYFTIELPILFTNKRITIKLKISNNIKDFIDQLICKDLELEKLSEKLININSQITDINTELMNKNLQIQDLINQEHKYEEILNLKNNEIKTLYIEIENLTTVLNKKNLEIKELTDLNSNDINKLLLLNISNLTQKLLEYKK